MRVSTSLAIMALVSSLGCALPQLAAPPAQHSDAVAAGGPGADASPKSQNDNGGSGGAQGSGWRRKVEIEVDAARAARLVCRWHATGRKKRADIKTPEDLDAARAELDPLREEFKALEEEFGKKYKRGSAGAAELSRLVDRDKKVCGL
jgi:hypothetical protein